MQFNKITAMASFMLIIERSVRRSAFKPRDRKREPKRSTAAISGTDTDRAEGFPF
jgi:hypothetical protein